MQQSSLHTLTEVNIDDLLAAWGLQNIRYGRKLLRLAARFPSARLARQVLDFDQDVGTLGLRLASSKLALQYSGGVQAAGRHHIPSTGPLLILSNHPGLTDTLALFTAINRPDLKIIALERPFLEALPNTAQLLYLLPDSSDARAAIARKVARDLKNGQAALTFPAGQIEPDPLTQPGAENSLKKWANSIGLFARLVPELRIIVAIVGGVFNPRVLTHPFTRLRRSLKDRELLAASLQIAWAPYHKNIVRVAFAPPIYADKLLEKYGNDIERITQEITSTAQNLLDHWPDEWETVITSAGKQSELPN